MNGQSTYLSALMTVFALVACAGLYFVIDAQSEAARQAARAEKAYVRFAEALDRLAATQAAGDADRARLAERLEAWRTSPPPTAAAPAWPSGFIPGFSTSPSVTVPFAGPVAQFRTLASMYRAAAADDIHATLAKAEPPIKANLLVDAEGVLALVAVPANRVAEAEERLAPWLAKTPAVAIDGTKVEVPGADAAGPGEGGADDGRVAFAQDAYRDPDATPGDGRVMRTSSFPGSMNPLVENESFISGVHGYCVASLAERDLMDVTRFEPVMAERWTISEDGLVFTIRLRDTFKWQAFTDPVTGRDVPARLVTAGDFAFFWEIIQNKDIPCEALRSYYGDMDAIEAVDDRTVRVTWKRPYSLAEDFTLGLQPWPRHYYRPDPATNDEAFAREFATSPRNRMIVGTGPYRMLHWKRDSELVLVRDPQYGGPPPPLERLTYRLIQDEEIARLDFEAGRLDALGLMPQQWRNQTPAPDYHLVTPEIATAIEESAAFDDAKRAGAAPDARRFEKYMYPGNSWTYIGYNMRRPVLADRKVRLALTHLVDRRRILREVMLGLAQPISGPFVPRSPYYNHDVKPWPFDPARAKALLAEAGWADTDGDGYVDRDLDGSGRRAKLAFALMIPQNPPIYRRIAALVEQDMRAAGVQMETKPLEWSVFIQQLDNFDYDACILGWAGGIEGDPYQIWHSSQGLNMSGSNHVGYASKEADALIEEGRRTMDKAKRYEIYRRFHALLHEDQPYTFLFSGVSLQALDKRYRNVRVYRNGMSTLLQWVPPALRRTP